MHDMKILFIIMVIMAVITFSGITFEGDAYVPMAAVTISGLLIILCAAKFICLACKGRDKPASQ